MKRIALALSLALAACASTPVPSAPTGTIRDVPQAPCRPTADRPCPEKL